MVKERWATLSVRDHADTRSLVPDILMYDRLVVPIPPGESEIGRWRRSGWNPELQEDRLKHLGDIAIRVPWDLEHQIIVGRQMKNIEDKSETLKLTDELKDVIPYELSRLTLSREVEQQGKAKNVNVLPAYHSIADFEAERLLQEESPIGNPAIKLANKDIKIGFLSTCRCCS
jgi:hypothetical protein